MKHPGKYPAEVRERAIRMVRDHAHEYPSESAAIKSLDPRPERGGRWSRMSDLAMLQCVPCKSGTPPLQGTELDDLLARLGNDWRVVEQHHLEKEFRFKNFREALDFTNRVGDLSEEQGHHPDIYLAWGKVRLTVWTHKIDGLTESDFVFAAESDRTL